MVWVALYGTTWLLLVAPGVPGIARRIVRVCGVYFFIAFTLRSTLLIALNPEPKVNSSFAISSLSFPSYLSTLTDVLIFPVASALGLYIVCLLGSKFVRRFTAPVYVPLPTSLLVSVYVIGYVFILVSMLGHGSGIIDRVGSLGQAITSGGLAAIVLGKPWKREHRVLVYVICAAEILLSLVLASKTPLLTILLLFYLDQRREKLKLRTVAASAAAIVVAFTVLQELKPNSNAIEGTNIFEKAFYSVLGRLDGLYSMAGAWTLGPGQYRPDGGVLAAAIRGFIPGWLQADKLLSGELWGINVYGVDNGTSYADGLAAEGYVMFGPAGPFIWGLAGGIIIIAVAAAVSSRSLLLKFVGLTFVASTAIFERGIFGQMEQLGSALQTASIVVIVVAFLSWVNTARGFRTAKWGESSRGTDELAISFSRLNGSSEHSESFAQNGTRCDANPSRRHRL